jgi:hypothetical protein
MKLFKYDSYDHYFESQAKKTRSHFDGEWTKDSSIDFVSNFVKDNIPGYKFGICHGVRNGTEVKKFNDSLKCNVIGTELVRVRETPNVIIHDFHDVKEEWVDNVDFIYSNAFDHSFNPDHCIKQWMSCIKKDTGLCFVEWTKNDVRSNKVDCFAANREEYVEFFSKNFDVKMIPLDNDERKTTIFVISHK